MVPKRPSYIQQLQDQLLTVHIPMISYPLHYKQFENGTDIQHSPDFYDPKMIYDERRLRYLNDSAPWKGMMIDYFQMLADAGSFTVRYRLLVSDCYGANKGSSICM